MTTENAVDQVQGTPEAPATQKTTEEVFYGKPKDEATTTVTPAPEEVKTETVETKDDTKTTEEKPYEVKLGEDAVIAPEFTAEFAKFAQEKGLAQEVAQEILNKQNSFVSDFVKKQNEQVQNEINQWAENARLDKEVGGDNFRESAELAKRVIDKFGTAELKDMLNRGMGNHPEALRVFARIGKALGEDKMIHPKAAAKATISTEELFYGSNK